MKILNVEQIRAADQYTIENEPIRSIDLMERASQSVANWILRNTSKRYKVNIILGKGNNAGDGLAVARILDQFGYKVKVYLALGEDGSNDFNENLAKLKRFESIAIVNDPKKLWHDNFTLWIDALFGSGLSRPVEGDLAKLIDYINDQKGVKLAIDMPSGLFADSPTKDGAIFEADYTLSFQTPKLSFFVPEYESFVGDFQILNIGLDQNFIDRLESEFHLLENKDLDFSSQQLSEYAHKGKRGRAIILAGGYTRMGAAILSLKGALNTGIGLLTAQVCRHCIQEVQHLVPESLILEDENEYALGSYKDYSNQDVMVFGPAVGFAQKTKLLFKEILDNYRGQLILDADAISLLAKDKELLDRLPAGSILTPHPGEFSRLVGNFSNYFDALMQLKAFAKHHKVVILLKGKYTAICNPEGEIYFNPTGNDGMAKGGSGDLLCGILAGLLPNSKNAFEATKLAVYLHGLVGDITVKKEGKSSCTPTKMSENLGEAFKMLSNF